MKKPREVAAVRDVHRLRSALRGLVDDTQHLWHACDDDFCPVRIARRVLTATDKWGERPCTTNPRTAKSAKKTKVTA